MLVYQRVTIYVNEIDMSSLFFIATIIGIYIRARYRWMICRYFGDLAIQEAAGGPGQLRGKAHREGHREGERPRPGRPEIGAGHRQ